MSLVRHPFPEGPSSSSSSPRKKSRIAAPAAAPPKVLTFSLSHSPVKVQLLSSHTIWHLVDIVCETTTVGRNEDVDDHLWDVRVPGFEDAFESLGGAAQTRLGDLDLAVPSTLRLNYDYGACLSYTIKLVSLEDYDGEDSGDDFPREKPMPQPAGFQTSNTTDDIDLNALFPRLNTFLQEEEAPIVNLFQPGRKRNFGYVQRGVDVAHMIFLPAKPGKDLSDYLHSFDYASQFKPTRDSDGHPWYEWYSMVVFPHCYDKSYGAYGEGLRPGFCDMKQAPANPNSALINAAFPKVAALAGCKKDKKVPKGWFSYKDNVLMVCSGSAKKVPCNAPKGTAFYGEDQHYPESRSDVLFRVKVRFQSLHHLFCTIEGLLRTL